MTSLPETPDQNGQLVPTAGLRAAKAVCKDKGVSDTTLWRWGKRGWIKLVNICGKSYVDLQSLDEFDRRAIAGEFSKAPHGAAARSKQIREKQRGEQ